MAMTIVVSGKIYNGRTHEWRDKNKEDRELFRGRLNYRDRASGEWHWIDAVCWKDFGDNNGLVGFLEKHFSADSDNAPKEKGGQPIELTGYLRPSTGKMTVPVTVKKNGKPFTFEVKDVSFDTFEFVIETVDFPPTAESPTRKSNSAGTVDDDFDFDEIDEDDIVVGEVQDEDDAEEEEETSKEKGKKGSKGSKSGKSNKKKPKSDDDEEDDDDFFKN